MKKLIFLVISILLVLLVVSCSKEVDKIISYTDGEGYHHLNPDSGIPANVDLHFIEETLLGPSLTLYNGIIHTAYKIAKMNDPSFVYFFDSYIGGGKISAQAGTISPINQWTTITVIVYSEGINAAVIIILDGLGLDFIEWIEDWMVEAVYEVDVLLSDEGGLLRIAGLENFENVTNKHHSKLEMNTQIKKFSQYVELNYDSIQWEKNKPSENSMINEIDRLRKKSSKK